MYHPGKPQLELDPIVSETLRTHYRVWTYYSADECPGSLLTVLSTNLPHIDPKSWTERFAFGGIYVNGTEALGDCVLPIPCKVEYYEPKFQLSEAASIFPAVSNDNIIFRDDYLAVAYKPPGLSSMPAKEQRHFSLKSSLELILGAKIHMPSRLDVSAQGLVIVSTSAAAHAGLQQIFEGRKIHKEYRCASSKALTWGAKTVDLPIGRSPLHPVLRTTETTNGQTALTVFENLGRAESEQQNITVMKAAPITGRTHQIRVHAAAIGAPLLGDRFYGGGLAPYLHLVSYSLNCIHPITGHELSVTLPSNLCPKWLL